MGHRQRHRGLGHVRRRSASDDGGGSYGTLGTTAADATSFNDMTVSLDANYIYRVTAIDNGVDSTGVTISASTPPARADGTGRER